MTERVYYYLLSFPLHDAFEELCKALGQEQVTSHRTGAFYEL